MALLRRARLIVVVAEIRRLDRHVQDIVRGEVEVVICECVSRTAEKRLGDWEEEKKGKGGRKREKKRTTQVLLILNHLPIDNQPDTPRRRGPGFPLAAPIRPDQFFQFIPAETEGVEILPRLGRRVAVREVLLVDLVGVALARRQHEGDEEDGPGGAGGGGRVGEGGFGCGT